MPIITLQLSSVSQRGEEVRKILKPLTDENGPGWRPVASTWQYVFGFFDYPGPSDGDYTNWRFRTRVHGISAMYHERWVRHNEKKQEIWFLERSYLHLYELDPQTRFSRELICLHCEPNETEYSKPIYSHGPHLHIKTANHPVPKAHLALNVGNLDSVLSSIEDLTVAIQQAVLMLDDEVLARFEEEATKIGGS